MLKKIIQITVDLTMISWELSPYQRDVIAAGGLSVLAVSIGVLRSIHDLEAMCL
jgi:hypothetical protein